MITGILGILGISLPSLLGGGGLGLVLEIIGLIGKGKAAAGFLGKLSGPTSGTLVAQPAATVSPAPAAPATPQAKPLPPAPVAS